MRSGYITALLLLLSFALRAQVPDINMWVPNGPVHTAIKKGNSLYIGGKFDDVGPCTGNAALIDSATGNIISIPPVDGRINVVVADLAGGCYIGGNFDRIGGFYINNLAYIKPDGTIDPDFRPQPDGEIFALLLDRPVKKFYVGENPEELLYVGGRFTTICSTQRFNAACVRVDMNQVTQWQPDPDGDVYAFALDPAGWMFVGGSFSYIGGQQRLRIAKTSIFTGIVVANNSTLSWNLSVNNTVRALALYNNTLYVGGDFTLVGMNPGTARTYLASMSINTPGPGLLPWNPVLNGPIKALELHNDTLYTGGSFTSVNTTARPHAAAFELQSHTLCSWNPAPDGTVLTIDKHNSNIYLGGDFTNICGQPRKKIACVDASGALQAWNPHASGIVRTLSTTGSKVYAGGDFISMNGVDRNNLAKIDLATGIPIFWNPGANNTVMCMDTAGSTLSLGGLFTSVGNQQRNHIAALDLTSGGLTSWDPNIDGMVRVIRIDNGNAYAGGAFSSVGSQTRNSIAQISLSTGIASPWNPDVNGTVNDIVRFNNKTYIGGFFSTVSGFPHSYLAELDTAAVTPVTLWDPSPDAGIYSILEHAGSLYMGGWFTMVDGQSRQSMAAVEIATGTASSWTASTDAIGNVRSIFLLNDTLYAAGEFNTVNGSPRSNIAGISILDGTLYSWNMGCNDLVQLVRAWPGHVLAGGTFRRAADIFHPYLVVADNSQTVGIYEQAARNEALLLYPNPSSGILNIDYKTDGKPHQLNIYNTTGQLEMSLQLTGKSIDVSALQAGAYFMVITSEDSIRTGRFVAIKN